MWKVRLNPKTIWSFLRETMAEFSEDKVPRLAAALSYYSLFSLAPLAIIAIGVAALIVGKEAATGALLTQIQGLIGEDAARAIQSMVDNARKTPSGWIPTVVGIVTLIFGASGVFAQLQDALNTIWNVTAKKGKGILLTLRHRFLSFAMVLGIGFLLLVSLVLSAGIAGLGKFVGGFLPSSEILLQAVTFLLSFGVITVLFALIFKLLPDVRMGWRNVWTGAAVTALLFSIGKLGIGLYLGKSSISSAFGAAGAIVIVIVWVYYSSLILFLGAEFTQVLTRRREGSPPADDKALPQNELAIKDGDGARRAGSDAPPSRGRVPRRHVDRPSWKDVIFAAILVAGLQILERATTQKWGYSPRQKRA
jgi:membrane protein